MAKDQVTRKRRRILAGILAIASFLIYDPSRLENTSGDTISSRYWPVAILKHHTITLNPFQRSLGGVGYAALYTRDWGWMPRHGWGVAVFTVPFYFVADLLNLGGANWDHERISHVSRWNGMLIAAVNVVLVFYLLNLFLGWGLGVSAASASLFAFGTWNWSLAAQGLSPQGMAVLLILVSLMVLWKLLHEKNQKKAAKWALFMGLIHALLFSVRFQDLILMAPMGLIILQRRLLRPYIVGTLPLLIPVLTLNLVYYENPMGWGSALYSAATDWQAYTWNLVPGFFGLLIAPNRGLIVFFPLLLLLPYFWRKWLARPEFKKGLLAVRSGAKTDPASDWSRTLILGIGTYFLSITALTFWHSTWSYGPRYMYDLLPLAWPALTAGLASALVWRPKKKRLSPLLQGGILALALQCVLIHGLGHFRFDIYVWHYENWKDGDIIYWRPKPWFIWDVIEAGSNRNRWPSAEARLKKFGF